MDTRKSVFQPNRPGRWGELPPSENQWNRRSRNNPYPSSFYSSNEEEPEEKLPEKTLTKKNGPLILPPPPIISRDRKKIIKQENKTEAEPVRRREEEIIPLPEDFDEDILMEKKEQLNSAPKESPDSNQSPLEEEFYEKDLEYEEDFEQEFYEPEGDNSHDDDWFEEEEVKTESKVPDKDIHQIERVPAEVKKARLPVLLLKEEIEIDIFDSFTILMPLTNVSNVEWKVKSFKGYAPTSSDKVFLELVMSAEIEFVSRKDGTIHTLKLYVPLQKTVSVNWITEPELPHTSSREFYFREKDGLSVSTHREWEERLVPDIAFHLNSFQVIWHDELLKGIQGRSQLGIQGTAKISVEASQKQTVSIEM